MQRDPERDLAVLLRAISRDVAHELRGPVQSVVVNLEVLKRRAARGEMADVESRAALLEDEVRRLHAVADGFLALIDPPPEEPSMMAAEILLALAYPMIDVIAKARRVTLERSGPPPGMLARVRPQPLALALIQLALALCDSAAPGDSLGLHGEAAGGDLRLRLELVAREGGPSDGAAADAAHDAMPAAEAWVRQAGGTATLETGSDKVRVRILIELPRAT